MASWNTCEMDGALSSFSSCTYGFDTTKSRQFSFTIINGLNSTYGYDIFVDGKLMVHQPTIPAVSGQNGFAKKKDAEKVAELVISKIKAGIMPPTVTKQEMEKLGVSLK